LAVDAAPRIVHFAVCGAVARGSGPSPPPFAKHHNRSIDVFDTSNSDVIDSHGVSLLPDEHKSDVVQELVHLFLHFFGFGIFCYDVGRDICQARI
jgi:hypothetical protein